MTITVSNRRDGATGVYCGRPSALGNPYRIGPDGGREEVIARYERWLRGELDGDTPARRLFDRLLARRRAGEDLTLVCHCAPQRCHADVIQQLLEEET